MIRDETGLVGLVDFDDLPDLPSDIVKITGLIEGHEVLRSQLMSSNLMIPELLGETLVTMDPPRHNSARRALGQLVKRDAHRWFRDRVIGPTLTSNLDRVLANPEPDGIPRTDLVDFGRRIFLQMSARLVGIDDLEEPERETRLIELLAAMMRGAGIRFRGVQDDPAMIRRLALEAKATLFEEYYTPSLQHRRELVRRLREGALLGDEVPKDFLTMVAADFDAEWTADPDRCLRQACSFLVAGSLSSARPMPHAIAELDRWFTEHPEDRQRRKDPAFLHSVISEVLRLHPGAQALWRQALNEVTLTTGRVIREGQLVAVVFTETDRDATVFGADADQFNPYREVPKGTYAYGLAFGTGHHMCFGLPLAMGGEGIDGAQVYVLKALYDAGVERDRDRPVQIDRDGRDVYERFPVLFRASSGTSPAG